MLNIYYISAILSVIYLVKLGRSISAFENQCSVDTDYNLENLSRLKRMRYKVINHIAVHLTIDLYRSYYASSKKLHKRI